MQRQLDHELKLVEELSFADYFLTIWEIVEFARERKILCQGRGSAANSAICYCLGITAIDPVRMNLLFERFISVERGEPPDIDVDFEHERREEVIQHIYEKYGRDRAGMVAAVITYRARSALRDISKALELEPEVAEGNPCASRLMDEIMGFPRHLSIHSGGFTLSADPLLETVPIEPARMEGRTIVQWDKDDLAAIGLLKVDVLALGMLSALRKCLDQVGLELYEVPADDKPTYDMICRGDTVGTFQIESRAQIGMLKRLLPAQFLRSGDRSRHCPSRADRGADGASLFAAAARAGAYRFSASGSQAHPGADAGGAAFSGADHEDGHAVCRISRRARPTSSGARSARGSPAETSIAWARSSKKGSWRAACPRSSSSASSSRSRDSRSTGFRSRMRRRSRCWLMSRVISNAIFRPSSLGP